MHQVPTDSEDTDVSISWYLPFKTAASLRNQEENQLFCVDHTRHDRGTDWVLGEHAPCWKN